MKSIEELAQWVTDNRNNTKITDLQMFQKIVEAKKTIVDKPWDVECNKNCNWLHCMDGSIVCKTCGESCEF